MIWLYVICFVFVSAISAGDEDVSAVQLDGPGAKWRDKLLDNLVGRWRLTRTMRDEVKQNIVEASWVLNHQFLKIHMIDVESPPEYEAIVLVGYDHTEQRYIVHWTDTWGGKFSAMGDGIRVGDTIPITFHYPDGPFYNTFIWDHGDGKWRFVMESVNAQGGRIRFAEDVLVSEPLTEARKPM